MLKIEAAITCTETLKVSKSLSLKKEGAIACSETNKTSGPERVSSMNPQNGNSERVRNNYHTKAKPTTLWAQEKGG